MGEIHEFEAMRIAILLDEEARYERKQRKQQSGTPSSNGGFSEAGFEVDFEHGAEDTNDYTDKEIVD